MDAIENPKPADLEPLVAEIVSSYVRKNHVAPDQISLVIETVHQSLVALGKPVALARTPAVPIRQAMTRNYVICLDCGWRGQTLSRHIQARHGLKETDYRARWGLPSTHRLTATAYSEKRSAWAKRLGRARSNKTLNPSAAENAQAASEPALGI